MNRIMRRIIGRFCTKSQVSAKTSRQDYLYEFDSSTITLCTKINTLSNFTEKVEFQIALYFFFKDFQAIDHANIRRVIYDVSEDKEIMECLTEKYDAHLEKFFSSDYLCN